MYIDLICKNCKYWKNPAIRKNRVLDGYSGLQPFFYWCEKFNTDSVDERATKCSGRHKIKD